MTQVILIHGAWSTGAAWTSVVPALSGAGHAVLAPTLPGHGDDPTPHDGIDVMTYARAMIDRLPEDGPVTVVGHSMGGLVISQMAELAPERINHLIYVAAFLPRDGQSLLDLIKTQEGPGIQIAVERAGKHSTVLNPERAAPILFPDATPAQQAAALGGLSTQPNRAQTSPVRLTDDRFGRVAKTYILCTQDRTVTPDLQRAMIANNTSGDTAVHELDCGHFPQLSATSDLNRLLNSLL